MSPRHVLSASLIALSIAAALPASAQTTIAADSSANYASNGSNLTTMNGGSGFASKFNESSGASSSFFLGNSRLNGAGGGGTPTGAGINDANNQAFGIKSAGGTTTVERILSAPLTVGSTFSFLFDNGYIDNGKDRVLIGTATGSTRAAVEFGFQGGTNAYEFNNTLATGFGFTDGGLNVSFTLNTPTTYTMTATKLNDSTSFTYNGTLASALSLNNIIFQTSDSGTDSSHDFYFNSLKVVNPAAAPEPSQAAALLIGALGIGGLMLVRRRQNLRFA